MQAVKLLDMLYPRNCAGCGGGVEDAGRFVCWNCRADMAMIGAPHCSICGNPVEGRIDHAYVCYHCSERRPFFDAARSAARHDGVLRHLIHHFKYSHALWLQDDLVEILAACWAVHYGATPFDAVTYVPLHAARERERGYNQARLLARPLARQLSLPLLDRCLRRVRATRTQTHLTARDRALNVQGAFKARRPALLKGRRILVVDDVMTTGATLNECARVLKEAGAAMVSMLTLVRGG